MTLRTKNSSDTAAPEEQGDSYARVDEKAREHRTDADDAAKVKLGKDHRRGAVRNKTDERCDGVSDKAHIKRYARYSILAYKMDSRVQSKAEDKNKNGYIKRVCKGGKEEIASAAASFSLAKLLNLRLSANVFLLIDKTCDKVNGKARDNAYQKLCGEYL